MVCTLCPVRSASPTFLRLVPAGDLG